MKVWPTIAAFFAGSTAVLILVLAKFAGDHYTIENKKIKIKKTNGSVLVSIPINQGVKDQIDKKEERKKKRRERRNEKP